MRAAVPLLLLSMGCATVFRSSNRDLVIRAPADVRVLHGGSEVRVEQQGDGRIVANLPKTTSALTLQTQTQEAQTQLHHTLSVGWVVADVLFGVWPALIDVATGAWNNFEDVDANTLRWEARGGTVPAVTPMARLASLRTPVVAAGKLAVLDFRNSANDLASDNVRYFADVVRGATLKASPNLDVMTRENLLVLLQATGKDVAACEGECEVDTGRRIGADVVISGEVLKVGSRYKISLKLHDTHDGRLLSTGVASGKTVDELDEALENAATELLARR